MSQFDDILSSSRVGCWSWLDGRVDWDETTRLLFDRSDSPTDFQSYLRCVHPKDRAAVQANVERFVHDACYEDIEHRVLLSDGSIRWLFARGTVVLDEAGKVRGLQGISLDITALKERERRLTLEAETDPLTGLRNRRWLSSEGPREVARCERGAPPFSLAYVDVNNFKSVNDGPGGHDLGDRFLIEMAACLQGQLRLGDVLVRVGGDELVAFLPQTTPREAAIVEDRLTHKVAVSRLAGIRSTVSVGVSTWEPGEGFCAVLSRADRAMYRAKRRQAGLAFLGEDSNAEVKASR